MLICTIDSKNNECWTNPPNIKEAWSFIERVFKDKHIKAFRVYGKEKLHFNPNTNWVQGELF